MSVQLEQLNPFTVLACYLGELIWADLVRTFATVHRGAVLAGPSMWQQRSHLSQGGASVYPSLKASKRVCYVGESTLWHLPPRPWIWLFVL